MNYKITVLTEFEVSIDPNDSKPISQSEARSLAFDAALECTNNVGGTLRLTGIYIQNSCIETDTSPDPNAHM